MWGSLEFRIDILLYDSGDLRSVFNDIYDKCCEVVEMELVNYHASYYFQIL